jgi:hypothetical protein
MSKSRFLTLLLSLALAIATTPAVMAQEESPAPETSPDAAAMEEAFDPASVPEFQQDEALAAYLLFEEELMAGGVPEEDIAAATDWLASEAANLSEQDVEELLGAKMLADREGDDGEFGKSEEEEIIAGDDDDEDDDA